MALLAASTDTLINWTRSRNPNLTAAAIVEILNQSNEIIPYMLWEEGNGPFMNRTTIRTKLPTVTTRQIGQGIPTSTSRTIQVDDAMAILDVMNEVDMVLADAEGDSGQYRLNSSIPFFEAMSQQFAELLFYGNSQQNATDFFGLSPRYATGNPSIAANSQNVLDGGGVGSANTSVWLLTLSDRALTGIFPKGSSAGLTHKDWGMQLSQIIAGYGATKLPVYQDQYTWKCGIALKDWRWCARLANVDTTNLANESNAVDLIKNMIKMMYRLPTIATPASISGNPMSQLTIPGRSVFVCNRTVREMLHIQALNKTNNTVSIQDVDGRKVLMFFNIPVLNVDQILSNEAVVAFS